jgi:hypothetical protein
MSSWGDARWLLIAVSCSLNREDWSRDLVQYQLLTSGKARQQKDHFYLALNFRQRQMMAL